MSVTRIRTRISMRTPDNSSGRDQVSQYVAPCRKCAKLAQKGPPEILHCICKRTHEKPSGKQTEDHQAFTRTSLHTWHNEHQHPIAEVCTQHPPGASGTPSRCPAQTSAVAHNHRVWVLAQHSNKNTKYTCDTGQTRNKLLAQWCIFL